MLQDLRQGCLRDFLGDAEGILVIVGLAAHDAGPTLKRTCFVRSS
jgi:hypothetical protein